MGIPTSLQTTAETRDLVESSRSARLDPGFSALLAQPCLLRSPRNRRFFRAGLWIAVCHGLDRRRTGKSKVLATPCEVCQSLLHSRWKRG